MGKLYDNLLPKLLAALSIQNENHIEVLREMKSGLSGAEVYEIELKSPSAPSGKFFLKIDQKDGEFRSHDVAKFFAHSVEYVQCKTIDEFFVLLIQIAGNSGIEFKPFFDSPPSARRSLIEQIVEDRLNGAIDPADFHPSKAPLSSICSRMLGTKIAEGGTIEAFLSSRISSPLCCAIQFQDALYPNPFYFAKVPCSLKDCYDLTARIHGDLHGENIFLAQNGTNYGIIDWALAREDGILFFDSAYLELSLLLRTFEGCSLKKWVSLVNHICQRQWDDLDFEGVFIIQKICEQEEQWIQRINHAAFSHKDKMLLGQCTARIIAGLNFTGKKNVENRLREKAFLFSCVFLRELFQLAGYSDWSASSLERWNQSALKNQTAWDAILRLADDCASFSEEYQYILICGSAMPQQKLMNEYLSYIPWRGVVSLSTNLHEPLNAEIGSVKHLRALQSTQSEAECTDTIQHSAVWWLYSNGYDDDPDTLTDSFAQWRNRNRRFLQYTVQEICTAAPPQELMIIMDCGSLEGEGEWNKVQALLEYFDENEDSGTQAAVLNAENQRSFDQNRLANLRLRAFPLGIESLADYAASYLNGSRRAGVWLPHRDKKTGIQLEEADEQYITSYVDIVGDHLLDPSVPSRALRAFYRGEPITWDAIDRALPVLHPRTAALAEEIRQRIDEEKWGRIKVPHTPGAGASVLTRTVCWQLRKSCPVVQLREVNMDTLECLQRVAALSRCPVLILMDGDFTISDVEAVESNMHSGIASKKYLILYTYRVYGASDDMRKLSVLDDRTAEDFERHYAEELKQSEIYPLDEISTRTANLGELTRTQTFREFRLPFFYGMYAFEEDFVSVSHYINQVLDFMNRDAKYYKAIRYLSLVTYFTGTKGLSFKILKKLLSMNSSSLAEIRKTLNAGIPSLVYTTNASYRICHPVIAYQILLKTCGEGTGHLSTLSFCKLCTEFIKDIRKLDRSDDPSAYVNQLVADLFTNREVIDHEATARDASRSSFSTAILALGQFNLQKEVFQCLVENFPKNAHCFQHYGRLLSVNEPLNLMPAKQQFNEAIQLDPESPLHYHARGTMYLRFCRQKLHSDSLKTPEDIYNECKSAVELALQDFFTTLDYARYTPLFNRSYPYSSILQICTIVIKQIIRRYDERYPGTKFWDSGTEIARWCHHLLSVARRYAMRTEIEHPEFEQNPYYAQMKRDLTGIKFSLPELEALIEKSPTENADLKIIYLSRLNTRREAWRFRTQQDLATITEYCETVTQIIGPDGGVLWKWFQAYIRMDNFSYAHALGFLENLPGLENSVTVNYLLQILYFCQFYETANPDDADKALFYQRRCRELSQTAINGDHRRSCRLFLTAPGTGRVPLTDLREDGAKLECTVIDQVAKEQSARMTLKLDPRFKAVFVPIYNQEVKTRQGFGLPVKAAIGFSYNGLYGFDLEIGHD